jgi:hypothetical protein
VLHLKKSIVAFERFELTFGKEFAASESKEQEVSLAKVQQKLFVDEFFSYEPRG